MKQRSIGFQSADLDQQDFTTACKELALRARPAITAYPLTVACLYLLGPYYNSHKALTAFIFCLALLTTIVRWKHASSILEITGPIPVQWKRRFDFATIASGVAWGFLGLFTALFATPQDFIILCIGTVTMGAGAIASIGNDHRLYFIYVYSLSIPNALPFFFKGRFESSAIGIVGMILATVASYLNWTYCRSFWTNLRLNREKIDEVASARERLEMVVAGSNLGTFDWQISPLELHIDQKCPKLLGYPPDKFAPFAGDIYSFVAPEDRKILREKLVALLKCPESKTHEVEVRLKAVDGTFRWFAFRGRVVQRDLSGRSQRVAGTYQDITQEKVAQTRMEELQRQIEESEKLKTLGVLAGGVAHDFNNLLTAFVANIELARMGIEESDEAQQFLNEAKNSALSAAELCDQLLAYAGKGKYEIVPFSLNQAVGELAHLLQVSAGKNHTLKLELAKELPNVEGDLSQIRQIILNLLTNAAESMGEKSGTILIETSVSKADDIQTLHPDLTPNEYVHLVVKDEGCGMSSEVLEKMFDPFFTTKFTGRGLGLASVLGIAKNHGGKIYADSEVNVGTAFHVLLPVCKSTPLAVETKAEQESPEHRRGPLTVLLVDDEVSVRIVVKNLIEQAGHQAIAVSGGEQALEMLTSDRKSIDLVLLDIIMPGMDGYATLQAIKENWPDLPVVLSSGYSEDNVFQRAQGQMQGFLKKPYSRAQLLETVESTVAGHYSEGKLRKTA